MPRGQRGLTPKQRSFVEEYLVDLCATQAAIRAGYSPRTANRTGSENLTKPVIRAAVDRALSQRSKRTEITADRVLTELARIGFADPRKLFDENGNLVPVTQLDDDTAASLAAVETIEQFDRDEVIAHLKKIRFWDKKAALELLGKHLGLFPNRQIIEDPREVLARLMGLKVKELP
jgi:phage terminase small subunit